MVVALAGCAAQPGARPDADDFVEKQEALVGAACLDDSGCEAWEMCNRIVCITTPCPSDGHCANILRWYDNEGAAIPDATPAGVTRTIRVERPESTVARFAIGVNIQHTWRGDLRVVLRSPAGTEHVLHDRAGGSADDLNISADLTTVFEGETAVGDWRLTVSDMARQDVGRLLTWSIDLDYAEAAPPPPPGRDVWAQVGVGIESAHPYANVFEHTWDLRAYSAGAARARIHFSRLETERGYDFVEVVDLASGAVLDRFDGRMAAFTTREYETGELGVRLVTDDTVTAWGFHIDRIEVFGLGCLEDDDCDAGFECPTEVVRCLRYPCFLGCRPVELGGEGASCRGNEDCAEDLYCGASGTCARDGACPGGDVTECSMPGNQWAHVLCVGYPTCESGACGWQCGSPPTVCTDGETRNDGCNVCSCSGGLWRCTMRYCPPVANEGEACGMGVVCADGLVCDRGRTTAPTCGVDQPGTCVTDVHPRGCTRELAPVCSCNGQTFPNECERTGIAPFAHEGECALAVAIPDANVAGINQRLDVTAPVGGTHYHVTVRIDHTYRGDLVVVVTDPDGVRRVLTNRAGGSADGFELTQHFPVGPSGGLGTYTLSVSDRASADVGVLRLFNVRVL